MSIKSKITILTVSILLMLSFVLSLFTYMDLLNDKRLLMLGCNFSITTFAEQINKKITELENNAVDLALMGEIYYQTGKDRTISEYIVKNVFEKYPHSLGGGLWFNPYIINPDTKYSCIYAYREPSKGVLIDEEFETESYDYLTQSWFKEIIAQVSKERNIAWSNPYYEEQGSDTLMTTVGAGIYNNNELIGISTVDWKIGDIFSTIQKMNPTENSFALFADKNNDYIIASTDKYSFDKNLIGHSLSELTWYNNNLKDTEVFEYNGEKFVSFVKTLQNDMVLIINVPEKELYNYAITRTIEILALLLFSCLIITCIFYFVLKRNVSQPIDVLIDKANQIGQGNLDVQIDLKNSKEFSLLSTTINKMTKDIKEYITNINNVTQEKEKIKSELSIARTIQYSVLPSDFFPEVKEMSIYATMDTAKEVGGDFYDFFFIDKTHFMFLIADVSGKGIPAALFMMTTKALIKSVVKENGSPKELIEKINSQVYENNKQGFFVTMFAAIVDISNGHINYINCGHNPPLIKRNGEYQYLKLNSNLVLGVFGDFEYKINQADLNTDDILLLYTDGVTEAFNDKGELYSEQRLLECLNSSENRNTTDLKEIISNVNNSVRKHIGGIEQSDDITMLAFKYNGKPEESEEQKLIINAKVEKYPDVCAWLEKECEKFGISPSDTMKLELVTEEIFVNIASYAYPNHDGQAEILLFNNADEITLKFIDSGIIYNPLLQAAPNIDLGLEQRSAGGLGIFMVKQTVDNIEYKNIDNKNILTITLKKKI